MSWCIFCATSSRLRINLVTASTETSPCADTNVIEQHGLCRALSYIIQTLSAEHAFGLRLSFPIKSAHIPSKWSVGGATADFMINVRESLESTEMLVITARTGCLLDYSNNLRLSQLDVSSVGHSTFQLGTLFQIPQYQLCNTLAPAHQLVCESYIPISRRGPPEAFVLHVSHRFSSRCCLNHRHRLEIFNSIIAHHPSENPNVIYALLRAHRTFEDLGTFTLASGLRDVRRIQRAKEEQSRPANSKGKSRAGEEVYDQPHEEKQRMLDRENSSLGISSREQSVDSLTEVRVVPRDSPQLEESAAAQPLVSPTIEQTALSNFPSAVSEKARGKRPERSLSSDTDNSLDRVTATAVGRNGFVPTQEWVRTSRCVVDIWRLTLTITGDIVATRVCRALILT